MIHGDAAHANPSLQAKLNALYALHGSKTIDLTLRAPYLDLLAAFGNPQDRLPPVIHVAGTNGKGSTIAFMRAMLEAAGKRVHVYTSPHLLRFNERIVLAGRPVDDTELEALLDEAVALNKGGAVTFFEMTTAIALAAFARHPADVLLLETGLGGRLDCTNVVARPLATVITAIGYDHMEFLGDTLEEIVGEKAGIIKPGIPCILAPQPYAGVPEVFDRRADSLDAPLLCFGRDWNYHRHDTGFSMDVPPAAFDLPVPGLIGAHQFTNAATAACTLARVMSEIPVSALATGVRDVNWPARLQHLTRLEGRPVPETTEIWFDGGHNMDAAKVLSDFLARPDRARPIHLIVGMLDRRDPVAFLLPLLPYVETMTAIPIVPGGHLPHVICDAAVACGYPSTRTFQAGTAIAAIGEREETGPSTFLITGSFYLAAEFGESIL